MENGSERFLRQSVTSKLSKVICSFALSTHYFLLKGTWRWQSLLCEVAKPLSLRPRDDWWGHFSTPKSSKTQSRDLKKVDLCSRCEASKKARKEEKKKQKSCTIIGTNWSMQSSSYHFSILDKVMMLLTRFPLVLSGSLRISKVL